MIQLSKIDEAKLIAFGEKYGTNTGARMAAKEKPDANAIIRILKPVLKAMLPLIKLIFGKKTYTAIAIAIGMIDALPEIGGEE